MDKQHLISVIVPVYNSETNIELCLNSIMNSNIIRNIEIILIDDNSADNSLNMCEDFVSKYHNIRLYKNKKNFGVGYTRNVGIKNAKCNYICFVDSDDYFEHFRIEESQLMQLVELNYDLVFLKTENKARRSESNIQLYNNLNSGNQPIIQSLIKLKKYPIECSGYFFNKKLMFANTILFPKIRIAEDQVFMCSYIPLCKTYTFLDSVKYIHTTSVGGLATNFKKNNLVSYVKGYSRLTKLLDVYHNDKNIAFFIETYIGKFVREVCSYIILFQHNKIILQKQDLLNEICSKYSKMFFVGKSLKNVEQFNEHMNKSILDQTKRAMLGKMNHIYIYCCSAYSMAIWSVLINNGIHVNGFIDDNRFSDSYQIFNSIHVSSFRDILLKFDDNLKHNNIIFIVGHPNFGIYKEIQSRISNAGVRENNILWVSLDYRLSLNAPKCL